MVAGPLLDLTFETQLEKDFKDLRRDAETFGIGFFGDAATIKKDPLVNVLATGYHVPAMVVKVVDCTERLQEGEKKDGPFIAKLFLPVIEEVDVMKNLTDIVFFDGGSNMQSAGRIIEAAFPRVTVVHGLEHVLSLVFEDIGKIPIVKVSFCTPLSIFLHY